MHSVQVMRSVLALTLGLLIGLVLSVAAPQPLAASPLNDPVYGYTLDIPDGWRLEKAEGYTLIFRPPAGEGEDTVSVSIQNRKAPATATDTASARKETGKGSPRKAAEPTSATPAGAEILAGRYVEEIRKGAQNTQVLREAPFRWDTETEVLSGRQAVVDFVLQGLPLRQWAVFLPNPNAPVVHVWIITAPRETFDRWLAAGRKTLDTLQPVKPTHSAKPGKL